MREFKSYDDLKETYDKGKFDIYYESGNTKYEVSHLGSTIFCYDAVKNRGMGIVNNFPLNRFYGIEKPIVIEEVTEEIIDNQPIVKESTNITI